MYKGLELSYASKLITEMTEEVVDYLNDNKNDVLPFDSIFGDKNRLVIPLVFDEVASKVLTALKNVKGFAGIDYDTGEVIRDIQLDPKYGGGKKQQRMKIGRAVQSLNISDDQKKVYLDWLARYAGEMSKVKSYIEGHNYSIVLSRAPIDIVRMSDHRNIDSCHSRGGSYFRCAIQEALTGGAIAYLIHKDSLDNISEEELQNADLFKDSDRGIRGVEPPLARLRIRKIENNDNGMEYAFPELRVYGDKTIPGFYGSVRDFIQSKQNLDFEKLQTELKNGAHSVRGGSYEDNEAMDIIRAYFEVGREAKIPYVFVSSSDESSEQDIETSFLDDGDFENELQNQRYRIDRMDNGTVSYDYNDEERNNHYATVWGTQRYDLSGMDIDESFDVELDSYDIQNAEVGKFGESWKLFIYELKTILDNAKLALTINSIAGSEEMLTLMFETDDGDIVYNADSYVSFVQEMIDCDNSNHEMTQAIKNALVTSGFVQSGSHSIYSRYKEFINDIANYSDRYTYVSVDMDGNDLDISTSVTEILIPNSGDVNYEDAKKLMNYNVSFIDISTASKRILKNLMSHAFDPQADHPNTQLDLPLNESVDSGSLNFKMSAKAPVDYNGAVTFYIHFITPNTIENISFELADFIDDMWLHMCNCMKLYIVRTWMNMSQFRPEFASVYYPKNYKQLEKIYSKYLN